jgi:hypothetical protein
MRPAHRTDGVGRIPVRHSARGATLRAIAGEGHIAPRSRGHLGRGVLAGFLQRCQLRKVTNIGVDPNDAKREAKRRQLAQKQCTTLAARVIEDGPYETSLTGRQVVNWKPAMSAVRRGLKDHFDLAIAELTRRQIMAVVDRIAITGRRGAAKDLRMRTHRFLEWCVGEGYVEHNVLAGYRAPKETRAQGGRRRTKGRAITDEEIIKVWHASGKLGTFGLLTRMCLLGGPRRSEPTMIEW